MKTTPLISIITVVYNGEKHLEETIQSVINQTYTNIEYIIIDGGSTDKTLGIIKKYKENIDYWISEKDSGIYDAMNKGIKASKGEYIGLVNSDDYYEYNAIEIIVNQIKKQPDKDVFFGNMYMINKYLSGKKIQTYKKGENLEKRFSIWHPTTFVKKQTYTEYGLFDTSYKIAADYELLLRFHTKKCKFQYINKAISNFREGGISYYNKSLANERFRIQILYTSFFNAHFNRIKYKITGFFQKVFMFTFGKKKYHNLRYKYLYS